MFFVYLSCSVYFAMISVIVSYVHTKFVVGEFEVLLSLRLAFSSLFLQILIIFHLLLKAYSTLDFSMHLFKVHFTMKLTYRSLPHDDDVQGDDPNVTESEIDLGGDTHNRTQWDDDCPWSEWYSAEDPIKGNLILNYSL